MPFAKTHGVQNGIPDAHLVSIEVDISKGLYSFSIVGLPNKAIEESRDRVSSALKNSGFRSPKQTNAKTVVSLGPAQLKKEGSSFDLPIAIGYLLASKNITFDPEGKVFTGELSLDGTIRPVKGSLSQAQKARDAGMAEIYVPKENRAEAAMIKDIKTFGVRNLRELVRHLEGKEKIEQTCHTGISRANTNQPNVVIDFDDIVGQEGAKRGLLIAAAGRHNIGLFGPPGTGKTMLAKALQSILPKLTYTESLEVTALHSAVGAEGNGVHVLAPIRSPHHSTSYSSMVGGGTPPRPGEISLAHRGVLILDEFPEFARNAIEALRQPMEEGHILIARGSHSSRFPARFLLVATLNPCPCGNRGNELTPCSCSAKDLSRYQSKLSGPILDRIDMWIEVPTIGHRGLSSAKTTSTETEKNRQIVSEARRMQQERYTEDSMLNGDISVRHKIAMLNISNKAQETLDAAATTYKLSGRGYHKIIKLARTIADLERNATIEDYHVLEALRYRKR